MGLLDNFSSAMDDPQTMGLLSAAGNMFQASGPSLMPHSVGQVLGAGLQGAVTGYKSTQDRIRENTALQLQNAQLAQALRQGQITQAVYQKVLDRISGGQTQAAMGDAPSQPAIAPPQGGSFPLGSGFTGMAPPQLGDGQRAVLPQQPSSMPPQSSGSFGLSDDAMLGGMLAGPGELGKAIVAANAPTDFTKLLRQSGIDPNSPLGKQLMQAQIAKQNNIPLQAGRAGAPMFDAQGNIVAMAPKIPDNAIPQIVNGRVAGVSALPGAAGVEQINAYAGAAGKNQAEPMPGVDGSGQPVFTNKFSAAGGFQIPAGVQASRDAERLQILQTELANEQDPANRARLQREIARTQGTVPNGPVRPAAAPGFAESQAKLANAGADRYIGLVNQASDSPTRVNVYDNILNLSKDGVQTGPTAEWSNKFKGYLLSVPGVDKVIPGMKSDVSNYQEITKFMYQNAQRNWQAAGGTGTDSQLEAFSKSNPNEKMFPQALQAMAQWGKAGELALQAKTNALQQWKDAQGGNVANQDQFERTWRNNFDPLLFQLQTMPPDQAAQVVSNMKKTNPNGYANLMLKMRALKNIGGLK